MKIFLEKSIYSKTVICPICKDVLNVAKYEKTSKMRIFCSSCSNNFEIIAQIPIFLQPGQFADWTHPFVEMLFGNIRISIEKVIEKHGTEKIKNLYLSLMKGEYTPSLLFYKRPIDQKLIASGSARISSRVVEKHFKRIDQQIGGDQSVIEMISHVKNAKHTRILDACSGGGFFLAYLLKKISNFNQFFSYDIDFHCSARVEGILRYYKIKNRSLSMVADARSQPFSSNFFDVITNNYGFSHIIGYPKALRETFRILAPEGTLIVRQGFNMPAPPYLFQSGFLEKEIRKWYEFGNVYIDKNSFLKMVEETGFSIKEVKDFENSFVATCVKP